MYKFIFLVLILLALYKDAYTQVSAEWEILNDGDIVRSRSIDFVDDQCVPFSKAGFFDSKYLKWQGEMADQRISDLLPFEYWPYY